MRYIDSLQIESAVPADAGRSTDLLFEQVEFKQYLAHGLSICRAHLPRQILHTVSQYPVRPQIKSFGGA